MTIENNELIDMTPSTNIYGTFANYNYKMATAIPEFIDNSVASFRQNIKHYTDKNEKSISIIFDEENKRLIIRDTAFGIKRSDLPRALRLKSEPKDRTGLNEFGMGLKTAAFWMGDKLTIITKSPFEKTGYEVTASLEALNDGVSTVQPIESNAYKEKWNINNGTVITIDNVSRSMTLSETKKIIEKLASKYRRDILNNGISFRAFRITNHGKLIDLVQFMEDGSIAEVPNNNFFKGRILTFQKTNVWVDENTNDGYKTQFAFKVQFNGIEHNITGELFVRKIGSRSEAGLDLFRRDRIIEEKNRDFISDASSFQYQRVNGFLNMDSLPVTQAKDGFVWEGDLFDKVFKKFHELDEVKNILKTAGALRVKNSDSDITKTKNTYVESISKIAKITTHTKDETKKTALVNKINHNDNDVLHIIKTSYEGEISIYSRIVSDSSQVSWLEIERNESFSVVSINANHPFYTPFNDMKGDGQGTLITLRKLSVIWAWAEYESIKNGEDIIEFRERFSELMKENE